MDSAAHQISYTFYLKYEGPLPTKSNIKELKVDITINECVYFPPEERPVLKSYDEYSDLPANEKIFVYSLNEIAAEIMVEPHDRVRTEPRDLYDIWYLTEESISSANPIFLNQ